MEFFALLKVAVICLAILAGLFLILLAIPKTKVSSLILEILGITGATASAAALVSPLDLVPDMIPIAGQVDDLGYMLLGILCAIVAYNQHRNRQRRDVARFNPPPKYFGGIPRR